MKEKNKKFDIDFIKKKFEPFLKNNPFSSIQKEGKNHFISNPWGDKTLAFLIAKGNVEELTDTLNNVILAPRFTAFYHLDSNTMEYIYAPIKEDSPYASREFEFILDGKTYNCQFKSSSERLITLSKFFIPFEEESTSDFRNLWFYTMYVHPKLREHFKLEEDFFKNRTPISFFVSGFEKFDEEKIVTFSKHLNFFISHYDRESPYIVIHSAKTEKGESIKELQFPDNEFPKKISTSKKDPIFLDIAIAAHESKHIRLKLLYYYQILEYSAFYFVESEVKQEILRIITSPTIHSNPDKHINDLMEMITKLKETEDARLNRLIKNVCPPQEIFKIMKLNISYFSKRQEFEGGFYIEPLMTEDMTLNDFSNKWYPRIPEQLRKIRNALVHSRETRLGLAITPSKENDFKLKPWISVVRCIAEQVIIYC